EKAPGTLVSLYLFCNFLHLDILVLLYFSCWCMTIFNVFLLFIGGVWCLLDETMHQKRRSSNVTADAIVEVERYMAEVNLRRHEDPLEYWHTQTHVYPYCLARECFPRLGGSSADEETAFNQKQ
ncbi:hypothetical protein XENOCAPTIV_017594, partial [Xenoophorus captivus]